MVERRIETVTRASIRSHIALARTTYDTPAATEAGHFWWKHGEGPAGPSTSISLYDGDVLVGRALLQPRRLRIDKETATLGAVIFDVMLDPSHRGAMNFLALVPGEAEVPAIDVVVHTSNALSDPLYRKLLRYEKVCRLAAAGLPVRGSRILRKLTGWTIPGIDLLTFPWRLALRAAAGSLLAVSNLTIEPGIPSDADLDRLAGDFTGLAGPHFERDRTFLEWRFGQGPTFNGTVMSIRRKKEVCGYLVWRKVTIDGIEFLVLMDLVLGSRLSAIERLALRFDLVARACHEGADMAFVMMNPESPIASEICGVPFVPIKDSRLPHPTPIFVRPRHRTFDFLKTKADFFVTLADIDYF